jgi:hypothetical protein
LKRIAGSGIIRSRKASGRPAGAGGASRGEEDDADEHADDGDPRQEEFGAEGAGGQHGEAAEHDHQSEHTRAAGGGGQGLPAFPRQEDRHRHDEEAV